MHSLIMLLTVGLAAPTASAPERIRQTAVLPCSPFATCASVTLTSVRTATTSRIGITIRNPHNLTGWLLGPYVMNTWGCTDPTLRLSDPACELDYGAGARVELKGVRIATEGAVRSVGMEDFFPDVYYNLGLQYTHNGGDFFGCGMTAPYDPNDPFSAYYSICPAEGFGGGLTIYYDFLGQWSLSDFTYVDAASAGLQGLSGDGQSVLCTLQVPCTVSVAPEPTTWALMITGLLGFGAVAWRRRRPRT